jgi:hypothetical protein
MKIFKFYEYIKENLSDTPESYISSILTKIKIRVDKMFLSEIPENNIRKIGEEEKETSSFKDMGLELQSSEISKYSKMYDNLKVKYSDSENLYDVSFIIDLKDAIPTDKDKDFNIDDIKKCYIKFKMYTLDEFELVGTINKTVNIDDINSDLLTQLKIELDKLYGNSSEEEEFKIETE